MTILLFCESTDVRSLWNQFHTFILEDYTSTNTSVNENLIPMLLRDLNDFLIQHGKAIKDFDLPPLSYYALETTSVPRIIQEELLIQIPHEDVEKLNDIIIDLFPGEERNLLSFDEVEGDTYHLYQHEYLHTISLGGLPPHNLKVKKGSPLMLLRNIDPKSGLCSGTRLLCRGSYMNMLDVEILTGHHAGNRAFLPRIKHKTTDGAGLPFVLIRKQFPVRLSLQLL